MTPTSSDPTAGAHLATARRAAGLTQADIAAEMGTTQAAISRLERGDSDPRLSTVLRYLRAAGGQDIAVRTRVGTNPITIPTERTTS